MWKFGEYAGIAFQIKDDLFDYQLINKTGKPSAKDIKEQKMTLPLIYLLKNSSWVERKKYIRIVKHSNENPKKVNVLFDAIGKSGGIDYATQKMKDYYHNALEILKSFPKNDYRDSLEGLLKYTIEREK
jgi:octaprenyl-diphosphate synthase